MKGRYYLPILGGRQFFNVVYKFDKVSSCRRWTGGSHSLCGCTKNSEMPVGNAASDVPTKQERIVTLIDSLYERKQTVALFVFYTIYN